MRLGVVVLALVSCLAPSVAQMHVINVMCCGFQDPANGNSNVSIVAVGTTVQWVRTDFILHTVTSGTGALDPQAGSVFHSVLNASTPTFTHTFNTLGKFPYFCQPHEPFGMTGVVHVVPVASSTPSGAGCNSSAGQIVLSTPTLPQIGNAAFGFDVAGGPPGAQAFVYIGLLGAPLPVSATCFVYLDLQSVTTFVQAGIGPLGPAALGPGGSAFLPLPLPNLPEFGGLGASMQAVVFDPAVPLGLAVSNAVTILIGV
jgi:plastocyanin